MQIFNRFIVFTKRILTHKMYIIMLVSIIASTVIYVCLPAAKREADINVAVYSEESSDDTDTILEYIDKINSIYSFYTVESRDVLIKDVKSGNAECGYYIPKGFLADYISGNAGGTQIIQYTTPSTSLGATINETLFSSIFAVSAGDILTLSVGIDEYDAELNDRLSGYMDSDDIFRISNSVDGELDYAALVYKITIPVYELCLIFLLFAGFLGLLLYEQDAEKGMYICLSRTSRMSICITSVFSSMLPIMVIGMAASAVMGFNAKKTAGLALAAVLYTLLILIFGTIIRKSTLLTKVLPVIVLADAIIIFAASLI